MSRTLRILLVEDHPEMAELLQLYLERLSHDVTHAASVTAAVLTAALGDFDLVVSDYRLGDGTGLDLMRSLRDRHGLPGICLTGYGEEVSAACHAAGFECVLTKPVDLDSLASAIGGVLESAKL